MLRAFVVAYLCLLPSIVRGETTSPKTWFFEGAIGPRYDVSNAFTERLRTFRYTPARRLLPPMQASLRIGHAFGQTVSALVALRTLDMQTFKLGDDISYAYAGYGASAEIRARTPQWGRAAAYGQLGVGTAVRLGEYRRDEIDAGTLFAGTVGVVFRLSDRFALFVDGGWIATVGLQNAAGDHHELGGGRWSLGLRFAP